MTRFWRNIRKDLLRRWSLALLAPLSLCLVLTSLLLTTCSPEESPHAKSHGALPQVVVTLKPIHSLVASLMIGRGVPALLLEGRTSPHTTALKPSQRKLLQSADLLVWVGPTFEVFLEKATRGFRHERLLSLAEEPEMFLLPQACAQCTHAQGQPEKMLDGHIWLDPLNGVTIARAVLKRLVVLDPEGRELYEKNFAALQKELKALDQEIRTLLKPYTHKPFFVVHQAYAYFIHRYHLQTPYTILANPEHLLHPESLLTLSEFLKKYPKGCVFFEPQFTTVFEKLRTFVKVRGGQIGKIDPLGVEDVPGPGLYCLLLRRCARSLVWCFSNS